MSGAIVVPLTEMQQFAEQWRATINEMDAMVQHIAREITSIPDSGKGLNEVRSRGRTVGSHHQQLLVQGMTVQKQVVDSVQRFSQSDQELAGMVRNRQAGGLVDFVRQNDLRILGRLPSLGSAQNGIVSNFIDQLIDYGEGVNLLNEIGLEYPKIANKFSKFTKKLFNLWPTTEEGFKLRKERASELGLGMDLILANNLR